MSIQKCLLDNSSRMIKAMSTAKSSNSEVKTIMAPRRKLTREEKLQKKRKAERLRYEKIKNDPEKYALQKQKEKEKYLKKKEKGIIKTVDQMTPREKRKARKVWKRKARDRRQRLALQNETNLSVPSMSNVNDQSSNSDRKVTAAKLKSDRARRQRYLMNKKKDETISKLKTQLACYKKRLQRLRKPEKRTPNSKVQQMLNSPIARETVKKKLLFAEVLNQQLKDNYSSLPNNKEKKIFKRMISGKLVTKYGILQNEKNMTPLRKVGQLRLLENKRKAKASYEIIKTKIKIFLEDDSNTRLCAGKRNYVTKKGDRKQKRVLLDTLKNLHKSFIKDCNIMISYSLFCRLKPFWIVQPNCEKRDTCLCIVHANIDLMLTALFQGKVISLSKHQNLLHTICCNRYNEQCLSRECVTCKNKGLEYKEFDNSIQIVCRKWESVSTNIINDPKPHKTRKVTKYLKKTIPIYPRDLIIQLEKKLENFLQHELNIVHQHSSLKLKKTNLTVKEAIIHMDFSENYLTKYVEEIQAFHFGGSRQQISLHTVVTYTKEGTSGEVKTTCYCSMSQNLLHSPPAIWAHLQPILNSLPREVEIIHFWSDGPVTQYRNKYMFYFLVTHLTDFYPTLLHFTWNYHEAGHGKGAPDGVGAVCKRSADRLVATGRDIASLSDLSNAIQEKCPNINVFVIDDENIIKKDALIANAKEQIKTFPGTLRVHQVSWNIKDPKKLKMKSLSCFCNENCDHFKIGVLMYSFNKNARLQVEDVYRPDSESENEKERLYDSEIIIPKGDKHQTGNEPSTSKNTFKNGDFILVKLLLKKTEYRYVAMCTGLEEDSDIQVVFYKIADKNGKLFKIEENDISFISEDQIVQTLPMPSLIFKGQRMFFCFKESVNVFEKA